VSLLTMHAAKGLEFGVVFVVGLEDGLTPFSWAPGADDPPDANGDGEARRAEERRLFYVAMTRAKDRLFLSRAANRFWRGQTRKPPRSPFLDDIAAELTAEPASSSTKRRAAPLQYSLF
jgi:superfamily I DNA/RNA helicase